MKKHVTTIVLVAVLAGGGVFAGIKITDMSERINELEISYASLQSEYDILESGYDILESEFYTLQFNHNSLQADYGSLQLDYGSLESSYESLSSDYNVLRGRMTQLEITNSELQTENERLRELLEQYENVPHGYYSTRQFPYHQNTLEELYVFLDYEFGLPTNYKLGIFDCSESATYVEWALENSGFDAVIAVGPIPWDPDAGYHAWVLVYFLNDTMIALEPTALTGDFSPTTFGIVGWEDPLNPAWQNYYEGYDTLLENIYQAIQDSGRWEWNWWEGYWGFM